MESINQINIRKSHPNLYRGLMTMGFISAGLGLNFLFTTPTFNPYQIDKAFVGVVFLLLGLSKVFVLNFVRNLKWLRINMATSLAWTFFWGIGTSITFFQQKTSLQLFVLYMGLSAIQFFYIIEPLSNPNTEVK